MMPRSAFWAPITASRFLSLQDVGGDDDFFSSDLNREEMEDKLGHIGKVGEEYGLNVLVAYSGDDEYVPEFVDKEQLVDKMCFAMNSQCSSSSVKVARPFMIPTGNHNLSKGEGDAERFVEAVGEMLSNLPKQSLPAEQ